MITEDYVSFETAKLLEEKRFNEKTMFVYSNSGELLRLSNFGIKDLTNADCNEYASWQFPIEGVTSIVSAPTLQMAMKWMMEVHKIGIFPSTYGLTVGVNRSVKHVYGTAIINLKTYELMTNDLMPMPTYEEATEVAIKYCLENLI